MRRFVILAALAFAAAPLPARAQFEPCVSVAVTSPPPPLPVYAQPPVPAPNYAWNPGYWAWGTYGYYWVPGTWVRPPAVGVYWTPGYWSYAPAGYIWVGGYWGPVVGFYGGISYGFGYYGVGYVGGVWQGSTFAYNMAVTNVNTYVVSNVYANRAAIHGSIIAHSRVSFNGGRGGVYAYPTHRQFVADAVKRYDPTLQQVAHAQAAGENRNNLLAVNHGRPPAGATQRSILAANQQPHFEPLTSQDRDGALRVALHDARPVGSPVTRPQAYQVAARSALQQFANRAHRAQVSRSAPANYMGPGGGQVAAHPSGGHGHGGHSKAGGHSKTGGHRKNGHAGGSPPPATI
jgi:hypothetical protein